MTDTNEPAAAEAKSATKRPRRMAREGDHRCTLERPSVLRPQRTEEAMRVMRCAVYTRKSTEDGLEQEFNSLDAQREACEAYVLSQRHEGWTLVPDRYDDGGYSGGNMERPGLKALLADVDAGNVDVIVVYKVDRLTRSLADFAKIVERLDAKQASFVSVTQAFNTTTSMGRLTLNVLLSFAQFEREVTGERIRDKIAASKKKGLWMGGPVPLGYQVVERKLVPVQEEAERVRTIMRRYLEVKNVPWLIEVLRAEGIVTKVQQRASGPHRGGMLLRRLVALMKVEKDRLELTLKPSTLGLPQEQCWIWSIPLPPRKPFREAKLRIEGAAGEPRADQQLIALLSEAREAQQLVLGSPELSIIQIAKANGRCRKQLTKLFTISWLSPRVVEAILEGAQPKRMTRNQLLEADLPIGWCEQEACLGFAA